MRGQWVKVRASVLLRRPDLRGYRGARGYILRELAKGMVIVRFPTLGIHSTWDRRALLDLYLKG
jgi:hypothetical protein